METIERLKTIKAQHKELEAKIWAEKNEAKTYLMHRELTKLREEELAIILFATILFR